ncbi:MAG: hypothetical protein ACEPO8_08410 [Rhodothermaceae bacterium]
MKKLKIDINSLKVEAFETGENLISQGTVKGEENTFIDTDCANMGNTCQNDITCGQTNCQGCEQNETVGANCTMMTCTCQFTFRGNCATDLFCS